MSFIIGFKPHDKEDAKEKNTTEKTAVNSKEPKKSLVEVYFKERGSSYTYYNDKFNLKKGDIVFVEGKLEGVRGVVTDLSYSFKIKLSDYKRVVALADTDVHGKLYVANEHFLSFDRNVIPYSKVSTWYAPPLNADDEIVCGEDEKVYALTDDMKSLSASSSVYYRGVEYFQDGNVSFLELDGENGRAIVEGNRGYTVEFCYKNGEISNLRCDCYCVGVCKHMVCALMQLSALLKNIEKNYALEYKNSGYVSVVRKYILLNITIMQREDGEITL